MNNLHLYQLQVQNFQLAKPKSRKYLYNLTLQLIKMSIEATLGTELTEHLDSFKHVHATGQNTDNSRKGSSYKPQKSNRGEVGIEHSVAGRQR